MARSVSPPGRGPCRLLFEAPPSIRRQHSIDALLAIGFMVSVCDGPAIDRQCPFLAGLRCPLVDRADIVVSAVPGLHGSQVRQRLLGQNAQSVPIERGQLPESGVLVEAARIAYTARVRNLRYAITAGSRSLIVRAIRASDAEAFREFDSGLSEKSRRKRYHGYMKTMDFETARRAATPDFVNTYSLVVVDEQPQRSDRIVAESRLAPSDGGAAELAVVVADDWQGHGLGRRLVALMLGIGCERGYSAVAAEVLYGNAAMSHVLLDLDFERIESDDVLSFKKWVPSQLPGPS